MDETVRYDLPDLRLVAAIADSGSLTRAAELVHLAPSSASHRLTQLEAALGVPLFARHARGLNPTAGCPGARLKLLRLAAPRPGRSLSRPLRLA